MADTIRLLAQSALAATTLTDVYTVPASTQTVVSSFSICNRGGSSTTFRISLAINGAADASQQYLYFDLTIPANDTFIATIGVTLDASDVVRAFAGNANLTVQVFGVEIT